MSTAVATMTAAGVTPLSRPTQREQTWLRSKQWDMIWITGSALLIPLPYIAYSFFHTDMARIVINLFVTLFVGGPHMYATWTRTGLEPRFRRAHKIALPLGAILIPAAVITMTLTSYVMLLTTFFSWASVHIMHQAAYISGRYSDRGSPQQSRLSRFLDYGVICTALYPIAVYKMVQGTFKVGPTKLWFPTFLQHDIVWMAASLAFATMLTAFLVRSLREYRDGTINWPKFLFILTTAIGAFTVPAFKNLDTSFQGFNTWHSFQYMGLTWHINELRKKQGTIGGAFVQKMFDRDSVKRFYGFTIALTVGAGLLIALVRRYSGFTIDQSYYTVTLSFLLVHYFTDHFLFLAKKDELKPEAMLAAA